jgi:enhancing lycopene biosynthesis protein 2
MTKRIAVVLSGCGFLDGAEIHESVLTLLHIAKNGAEAVCFAPNVSQKTVTNHLTKDASSETRNVLVESARIARGQIAPLEKLKVQDVDAVIFPGGFGAAI